MCWPTTLVAISVWPRSLTCVNKETGSFELGCQTSCDTSIVWTLEVSRVGRVSGQVVLVNDEMVGWERDNDRE